MFSRNNQHTFSHIPTPTQSHLPSSPPLLLILLDLLSTHTTFPHTRDHFLDTLNKVNMNVCLEWSVLRHISLRTYTLIHRRTVVHMSYTRLHPAPPLNNNRAAFNHIHPSQSVRLLPLLHAEPHNHSHAPKVVSEPQNKHAPT